MSTEKTVRPASKLVITSPEYPGAVLIGISKKSGTGNLIGGGQDVLRRCVGGLVIESLEPPVDAAIRETKEELGLEEYQHQIGNRLGSARCELDDKVLSWEVHESELLIPPREIRIPPNSEIARYAFVSADEIYNGQNMRALPRAVALAALGLTVETPDTMKIQIVASQLAHS